jgi:hypothetical protein
MKELTFKKKGVVHTPLTYWQIDKKNTIAIYQGGRGARPDLDFIVKHKEEGKRLRTPSHTHWIVDLITKAQYDKGRVKLYVEDMIKLYDECEPFKTEEERNSYKLQCPTKFWIDHIMLEDRGYYPLQVLTAFIELFSKCEKQTPDAFMFRNLLVLVKEYCEGNKDFYQIVGYSKRV